MSNFFPQRSVGTAFRFALCILGSLALPQALPALQTAEDVLTLSVDYFDRFTHETVHWEGPLGAYGGASVFGSGAYVASMEISGGAKGKSYPLIENHWKVVEVSATDTNGDGLPDQWKSDQIKGVGGKFLGSDPWATPWDRWDTYFGAHGTQFQGGQKLHYDIELISPLAYDCEGGIYFERGCAAARPDDCGDGAGSCSSGTCAGAAAKRPGSGSARVCSIHVPIDLGRSLLDGMQAEINLVVPSDPRGLPVCNPAFLDLRGIPAWNATLGYGVIYEADSVGVQQPRQIRTASAFADIQRFGVSGAVADGYYLRLYHLADIGSLSGSLYTIPTASVPYSVWRVYCPGTGIVEVTKNYTGIGGAEVTYHYTYTTPVGVSGGNREGGWTMSVSSGSNLLKTEKSIEIIDSSNSVIAKRRIVRDKDDLVVSNVYMDLDADGRVLNELTYAEDETAYRSRQYSYGDFGGRTQLVKSVDWDGHWLYYNDYDAEGQPRRWVEQLNNNSYTGTWPDTANRSFERTEGSDCEMLTEKEAGVVVARSWKKAEVWGGAYTGENNLRKITETTATDFTKDSLSDWADASNLKTVIYLYDETNTTTGAYKNSRWLEIAPDGTATLTKYFTGSTVINGLTVPTDITEIYRGLPSSLSPTAYEVTITAGTKTVNEATLAGETIYRRVSDIGTGTVLEEREAAEYDAFGRATEFVLSGDSATREKIGYACCGIAWQEDIGGVRTEYEYDPFGRLAAIVHYATGSGDTPPLRQEYLYDCLNRKTQSFTGPTATRQLQQETHYNRFGDIVWTKDGLDRRTNYFRGVVGGYIEEVTKAPDGSGNPSTATLTMRKYQDGRIYETVELVSPGVFRGSRSGYATDANGNRVTTQTPLFGAPTVATLDSESVSEWRDFAGRPWKTVSPSPTGSGTVTVQRFYNALGQLWKTTRPGQPAWLMEYDSRGRIKAEGADIDANNALAKSASGATDRSTEYAYSVGSATFGSASRICEITTTTRWVEPTTSLVAVDYRRADGLGARHEENGVSSWDYSEIGTGLLLTRYQKLPDGAATVLVSQNGRLHVETRNGATVTHAYDLYGRLLTSTHAVNGTTTYTYDAAGRLESVTSPDPDANIATTAAGLRPQTLRHEYADLGSSAGFGRRETLTRRIGGLAGTVLETTVTDSYPTGEVRLIYGPGQNPARYTYDHAGRIKTLTTWRDFDLGTGTGAGGGDTTTWNYNSAGRLSSKRYADNTEPSYTYDSAGRLVTRRWARTGPGASAAGRLTTYTYSATTGDLSGIAHDGDSASDVSYPSYDRLGRPKTIVDAAGTRTLTYSHTRLDDETYATGGSGGALLAGLSLTRNVDADATGYTGNANRLGGVGATGMADLSFRYDNVGRLQTIAQGGGSSAKVATIAYKTGVGSVETVTVTLAGTERARQTRTTDGMNRVTRIDTNSGATLHARRDYLYDDSNRRTRAVQEDGRRWAYSYDELGQVYVAEKRLADDTSVLPGYAYRFVHDKMGNRESVSVNGRDILYASDALNRCLGRGTSPWLDVLGRANSRISGGTEQIKVLVNDELATRTGEDFYRAMPVNGLKENTLKIQAVDSGLNQVATETRSALVPAMPEEYTYDADGNLTRDGLWSYEWDGENRLRAQELRAEVSASTWKRLEYAYDSQSRRIREVVKTRSSPASAWTTTSDTRFLYEGWNLIAEYAWNASTSTFSLNASCSWGVDLSDTAQGAGGVGGLLWTTVAATGKTYAPGYDANGNIIAYLDLADGSLAGRRDYGVFGEALLTTGISSSLPFGFSTKYAEKETGMYYYGFRYYNPSTGRWPNRDPIGESGGKNLYAMVGNNPVNKWDFLGLRGESCFPCKSPNAKKETDSAGTDCCSDEMKTVTYISRPTKLRPLVWGHGQIKIGDNEYIGFGPDTGDGAPGTTNGYGYNKDDRYAKKKFKACPATVDRLRKSASDHSRDIYDGPNICGTNCYFWAHARLEDAGLETPLHPSPPDVLPPDRGIYPNGF